MKLEDFEKAIDESLEFEGVGVTFGSVPAMDEYKVNWLSPDQPSEGLRVRVDAVLHHTWQELVDVMTGKKQPDPLYHVSRIVGYFSRIENWNPSKLGEMRDRRKGNYTLPESDEELVECSKCGGSGLVSYSDVQDENGEMVSWDEACRECGGTGKVVA